MIIFISILSLMCLIALFFVAWPLLFIKKYIFIFLSLFFLTATLLSYFYFNIGTPYFHFLQKQAEENQARAILKKIKDPSIIIQQLKMYLKKDPDSAQGWYLLGKLYFSQNDFKDALHAFLSARELKPAEINYQLNYLQTKLIVTRSFNFQDISLLKTIIRQNPENPEALNLLIAYDYLKRKYGPVRGEDRGMTNNDFSIPMF